MRKYLLAITSWIILLAIIGFIAAFAIYVFLPFIENVVLKNAYLPQGFIRIISLFVFWVTFFVASHIAVNKISFLLNCKEWFISVNTDAFWKNKEGKRRDDCK